MSKEKKYFVMAEEPFGNLVRILYDLLGREKQPTLGEIEADLRLFGVSPNCEHGPNARKALARLKGEAEVIRRKKAAKDLLERQKKCRSEDSIGESPMAGLGTSGGKGRIVSRAPDSDGEYKND